MLPSIPYETASVEPPGGSAVNRAMTRNTPASSGLTGGRAPRDTATRPAATPAAAMTAAAHSDSRTTAGRRCSGCHHGGPAAGWARPGTLTDGPLTQITTMMSRDTTMAATPIASRGVADAARRSPSLTLDMG